MLKISSFLTLLKSLYKGTNMFIIILLEVLKKFNSTIDIYNLDEFIKTLKFKLYTNQVFEQNEEEKRLLEFFELIKKKQEIEQNQIARKIEDEKEFNR